MNARSAKLTAATITAIGLLCTSASAQQSRPFNAGNACGDSQGTIAWKKGGITFKGTLRDFNTTPGSRSSLYVSWKGSKSQRVATVQNGQEIGFDGGAPIRGNPEGVLMTVCSPEGVLMTVCSPEGVLMTVCSDNCKHRWDCGRPG